MLRHLPRLKIMAHDAPHASELLAKAIKQRMHHQPTIMETQGDLFCFFS